MTALKPYDMKAAYGEIIAIAVKRRHDVPYVVGNLLTADVSENHARSIRHQITTAAVCKIRKVTRYQP